MMHVEFDPARLTGEDQAWWKEWSGRAERALQRMRQAQASGNGGPFDQKVWADLKVFLLERVFFGKCAYCETAVTPGFVGDAEHYRPKGAVSVNRQPVQHPGYYWLAYRWCNLMPSCEKCNSSHKRTEFPTARPHVVDESLHTRALDAIEEPYVLHPYHDMPRTHLVFGIGGVVAGRDRRGAETIAVLGLNRDALMTSRAQAQQDAFPLACVAMLRGTLSEFLSERVARPFFGAVRDYLVMAISKAVGTQVPVPVPDR